jgi:hypothetical protein
MDETESVVAQVVRDHSERMESLPLWHGSL